MDWLFLNEEEWMDVVKVNGSLDDSNYEIVKFKILRKMTKTNGKVTVLDFGMSGLDFFRGLLRETDGRHSVRQCGQES